MREELREARKKGTADEVEEENNYWGTKMADLERRLKKSGDEEYDLKKGWRNPRVGTSGTCQSPWQPTKILPTLPMQMPMPIKMPIPPTTITTDVTTYLPSILPLPQTAAARKFPVAFSSIIVVGGGSLMDDVIE